MAAPHVAGVAALLQQAHPTWIADEVKGAIVGSARPMDSGGIAEGSGFVDADRAWRAELAFTPGAVLSGVFGVPQTSDATLPVVARNLTDHDLTVDVATASADLTSGVDMPMQPLPVGAR